MFFCAGTCSLIEFELIKQRQLEGIAKAKELGAYNYFGGRKGLSQSTALNQWRQVVARKQILPRN